MRGVSYMGYEYDYERRILAGIKYARRFTGESISKRDILEIIEMAKWAPSIGNIQPWEIIVVDDPLSIRKLSRLHPLGRIYDRAGALFFIVTDPEQSPHHLIDGGSLSAYIALASSIKNYTVLIIGLNDDPAFKTELNIPPKKYLLSMIAIGKSKPGDYIIYPRKPTESIIYYNKHGLRY
jgi:nitroreductase